MNQTNRIHNARTPKGQKNWQYWELMIFKQCCGRLTKEQISSILIFLGSKRSPDTVARKVNYLGWSLKIK